MSRTFLPFCQRIATGSSVRAGLAIVCALVGVVTGREAQATLVSYDFNASPDNVGLVTQTGGLGWAAPWGASTTGSSNTGRIKIDTDANLTLTLGGYNITQTGTGRGYGDFNDFRGINRVIDTNLSGTVWFSILVQNTATTDHAGLQFNNHADGTGFSGVDYTQGNFDVQVSGTNLVVRYGGANTTVPSVTLALNSTHLLVGRITLQASGANDRFELWADPADLLNLGTPLFNSATSDLGSDLYLAGVFAYGATGTLNSIQGSFDALRISDGGGNSGTAFTEVTGVVPEPSTAALLGAGFLVAWTRRRRK